MENLYSDDVRQHLSFIQGVISRMNSNSFSMKGWMVVIVSALCAVYASNADSSYAYVYFIVAFIANVIFCFLDAYYLKMEKQYRKLYIKVLENPKETNFNMGTSDVKVGFGKALISPSVWILYLAVAVILLVALFLILK